MVFLQRKIYQQLKNHLNQPEISLILGPRQAGKTTLMLKLAEGLQKQGRAYVYFNLDVIEDSQFFETQHALIDKIRKSSTGKNPVVFIDEIQRLKNAGLFLKGLYDLRTGYKFIVSGSGSLELKADILEPMTGRKKVFYCLPLSFTEFAAYKLKSDFAQVELALEDNPYETQRIIREYFYYGGYPRVVLAQSYSDKAELLSEIYKSYLEKDIQLLLNVEKGIAFQSLTKLLATQVGGLINRQELASTVGIDQKTVEKYLYLLEKTYLISLLKPFYRNPRAEIRKSPKVYFRDLGMFHLASGKIPGQEELPIQGNLFENGCFLRLNELDLLETPKFWRTNTGAEVDFIIFSPKSGKIIAVEAKLSLSAKSTLGKSLISFIEKYQPQSVYLYNLKEEKHFTRFGVKIHSLPFHQLLDLTI